MMGMAIYSFGTIYFFVFCAKLSGLGPRFGLWRGCWFGEPGLSGGDGLGSESLFRDVHSGLGSKQQHLGSMQQGGLDGLQRGFGGLQRGFGGQQRGFGGHGLHFGCSPIFQSFGGPRKKEKNILRRKVGYLFSFPLSLTPKLIYLQRDDSDQGWESRAGHT